MTNTLQTILITGASSGFGRDMAETLAAAGHRVFAGIRDPDRRNHPAFDALRAKGIDVLSLDVSDDWSVEKATKELFAQTSKIGVVINNAGIALAGVSESFTPEQVRDLFEVNVFGVHRVMRSTLPRLRAQGDGLVINIGSILGRVTFPFFGLYGASKHALEALTDSYRYELSRLGVDVVLVQPSAYPTHMYTAMQQPKDAQRRTTYGEIGTIPEKMFATFMESFASADAPNLHDVAEAVTRLIATPKGERPERVVVGQAFGSDVVNAAVLPVQRKVVESLGLRALTGVGA